MLRSCLSLVNEASQVTFWGCELRVSMTLLMCESFPSNSVSMSLLEALLLYPLQCNDDIGETTAEGPEETPTILGSSYENYNLSKMIFFNEATH